ncbi:MAG TPA: hypothetical protein DFS52_04310 [Myxococcales bacterium]|jgi:hypothetical protein|nr:hypothetical protein [Myxococcales bacterium]
MTTLKMNESALDEYEREQRERAEEMLAAYDNAKPRRIACALLSMVWLSVAGQTVFPVGLLVAMMLLLPDMPAWTLAQRLRFTGRRALLLAGFALVGLLFLRLRIGFFNPNGSAFSLDFAFKLLPWR